jgi:DNA-binding PadR family transcriptional regulator
MDISRPVVEGEMMPRSNPEVDLPLKPAVFHILLALSEDRRHGLGIADEVENATNGVVCLGPGTLYRSLKEMTLAGLVDEVPLPKEDEDPRRRFYRITKVGRKVLKAEASRFERIVEVARRRHVLPEVR